MSSIITFAANNDLFRKRKRVYRACDSCKKRRKRCTHTFDNEDQIANDGSDPIAGTMASEPEAGENFTTPHVEVPEASEGPARSRSTSPSRFIGSQNPESVFLEQVQGGRSPIRNVCGYWMPRASEDRRPSRPGSVFDVEQQALDQYLAVINISLLPPQANLDALLKIYFTYIHPLLPIVDPERPGQRKSGKLLSPMLLQAICITTSRHYAARPHLILSPGSESIGPRDFSKRLYKSINAALNAKLEHDRTVLIQVLALLSLYVEGTDGAGTASIHLSQAIHHAHTIGMQFGRARADDQAEYFQDSYWCLWILDKLNSTMHGRPLFMFDRDSLLESPLSRPEQKYTAFGISLQIARALDHVITYYRPNNDPSCTGWEEDFPGFEEMIGESGDSLSPSILAFLELFYHSAAMVSHKGRPVNEPVVSTPSFVRQSLSTVRVIQILRDECPNDLPPLPIVPWSLSLAMANSYRQFRQSRLPTHRNRAKSDLQVCCDLLEKMRSDWWSAGAMADLGRAALKKAANGSFKQAGSSRPRSRQAQEVGLSSAEPSTLVAETYDVPLPQLFPSTNLSQENELATVNTITSPLLPATPGLDMVNGTGSSASLNLGNSISPDWLNFDTAFENFDAVLGSSGADLSMELLRPFNFEEFGAYEFSG